MCNLSLGIGEKGMAKEVAEGENKLASLLRMLVPRSDDFNKAISEDSEARAEIFKKYGMNDSQKNHNLRHEPECIHPGSCQYIEV